MNVTFKLKHKLLYPPFVSDIGEHSIPLDSSIDIVFWKQIFQIQDTYTVNKTGQSCRLSYRITTLCQITGCKVIGFRGHFLDFRQKKFA